MIVLSAWVQSPVDGCTGCNFQEETLLSVLCAHLYRIRPGNAHPCVVLSCSFARSLTTQRVGSNREQSTQQTDTSWSQQHGNDKPRSWGKTGLKTTWSLMPSVSPLSVRLPRLRLSASCSWLGHASTTFTRDSRLVANVAGSQILVVERRAGVAPTLTFTWTLEHTWTLTYTWTLVFTWTLAFTRTLENTHSFFLRRCCERPRSGWTRTSGSRCNSVWRTAASPEVSTTTFSGVCAPIPLHIAGA